MNQSILDNFDIDNQQVEYLNDSELACLLSHLCIWEKCIDENLDFIGVFEDDVHLGDDAELLLNDKSWFAGKDIIKLEKFHKKVELSFKAENVDNTNRKLHQLLGKNLGTAGYIMSNSGCNYAIKYVKKMKKIECIDIVLFNQTKYPKSIKIYQLQPAMVIQDNILNHQAVRFASTIAHDKRVSNRISLDKKIKRELTRAVSSIRMRAMTFS